MDEQGQRKQGLVMETDPRAIVAKKLLETLQTWSIPYVVVGDSRLLPTTIEGDIDIVIAAGQFKTFTQMLQHFCDEKKVYFIQMLQHEIEAWYCVIAWHDKSGRLFFLHPDICHQYMRKGRTYLTAKEMLDGRYQSHALNGQKQEFFVPEPSYTFIYYLIKKIEKGGITTAQAEYLTAQWQKNTQGSLHLLQRFWPRVPTEQLADMAAQNTWRNNASQLEKFRESLWKNVKPSPKNRFFEFTRRVHRVFNPTGLFVVFLGPDGSGKSAVLSRLQESLAPAFRKTKYYHHRPNWIGRVSPTSNTKSPHESPPRGLCASMIKLAMWWIDYFVGYWLDIYFRLVSSTLVLFDRYYYDVFVDSRRYRYGGSLQLAILIGKCIPKPDLVFLLDAPPEIILQRKQEVNIHEVGRQRKAYQELIRSLPNGILIDSAKPLDQVVMQIEQVVLKYMASRVQQRLGFNEKETWN